MPYPYTDDDKAYFAHVVSELEPLSDDDCDAIADVLARIRIQAATREQE